MRSIRRPRRPCGSRSVAALRAPRYTPRLRRAGAALLLATSAAACTPRAPTAAVSADSALVAQALEWTRPQAALHVTFAWSLQDRDARFSGRGVVRIEPPWRARLDLFGPRGEGYLSAVLQEETLHLPAGAPDGLLPPPAFLWATLGAVREPAGTALTMAQRAGDEVLLGFDAARERWRFRLQGERLARVEWHGPDGGRRTVELAGTAAHGLPERGVYRDWLAFRELTLSLETVERVDGFPTDTWSLGAR